MYAQLVKHSGASKFAVGIQHSRVFCFLLLLERQRKVLRDCGQDYDARQDWLQYWELNLHVHRFEIKGKAERNGFHVLGLYFATRCRTLRFSVKL
jgi:hypothetical protein